MSEAVLTDIDYFIRDLDVEHTRYVDDIRVFSRSKRELLNVLEQLTLYLHNEHRLSLAAGKTRIDDSHVFIRDFLEDEYSDEKATLHEELDSFNPYSDSYEYAEEEENGHDTAEQLISALMDVIGYEHLDLGLARGVLRTARMNAVPDIAGQVLMRFSFFAPIVRDVVLYLDEITDDDTASALLPLVEAMVESAALDSPLVRFWVEHYVARHAGLLRSSKLHRFVFHGPNIENQALAAVTLGNVSWVKKHKTQVRSVGDWERRAIMNSSRVLASDERGCFLDSVCRNSTDLVDKWVAEWVKADS